MAAYRYIVRGINTVQLRPLLLTFYYDRCDVIFTAPLLVSSLVAALASAVPVSLDTRDVFVPPILYAHAGKAQT
ncbi:hypothetical protein PUNSTDRAFT_138887 [Punctularia strigosozonata HHB-11173 SS5]|uniref:Uncharacterized protein n=1 Tax=Punctularia strigosozonata (strain HHB-11173) TaxID=741275 RepID=R7S2Z0_PUNST|nr:uncharacterized protein PUNSTDRAFT_138887 [Punctularia strigosozonata HHB-11173 SS5]EIN04162.1 hypothetical protein PUNSTDRAFT_138887 [Punctularia strigosozonata HHB-11173 SS5]